MASTTNVMNETILRRQIRGWIIVFIICIALSGITAFPLETELKWLSDTITTPACMAEWVQSVYAGVSDANMRYPFLSYGTDWLAFAHLIIALLFIGVLRDPVKNIWIIEWVMICCVLVLPLALIAGPVRHIPFFHQVIDCSFGIIGIIPLAIVRRKIYRLKSLVSNPKL